MANPTDNIPSTTANVLRSADLIDDGADNLRFSLYQFKFNAVITDIDSTFPDRYTVDVYEAGFNNGATLLEPTRTGLTAHILTNDEGYDIDDLVRIRILTDNVGLIVSEQVICIVKIVSSGPDGESDFTNEQYWGAFCYIANTGADSDPLTITQFPVDVPFISCVNVTNFGDTDHTGLSLGDHVAVTYSYDRANPIKRRWFVIGGASGGGGDYFRLVNLTLHGGDNGTMTSNATYTYDLIATAPTFATLATGVSPAPTNREQRILTGPATMGIAWFHAGTYALIWCDERAAANGCPS